MSKHIHLPARLVGLIAAVTMPLLLPACASHTPHCNDADSRALLDEIIEDTFAESAYGKELRPLVDYEVRGIRMLAHDKSVDSYECRATLTISAKNGAEKSMEHDFEYDVASVDDKDSDFEINYDDGIKQAILRFAIAKSLGAR